MQNLCQKINDLDNIISIDFGNFIYLGLIERHLRGIQRTRQYKHALQLKFLPEMDRLTYKTQKTRNSINYANFTSAASGISSFFLQDFPQP